jgi:hypothetical protein
MRDEEAAEKQARMMDISYDEADNMVEVTPAILPS